MGVSGAKPLGTDGRWRPGRLSQATVWAMPTHTGPGEKTSVCLTDAAGFCFKKGHRQLLNSLSGVTGSLK